MGRLRKKRPVPTIGIAACYWSTSESGSLPQPEGLRMRKFSLPVPAATQAAAWLRAPGLSGWAA